MRNILPSNTNTLDAGLTSSAVAQPGIGTLVPAHVNLTRIATLIPVDGMRPKQKQLVADCSVAGTVQTNPTNFEVSGATIDALEITPTLFSAQWGLTSAEGGLTGLKPTRGGQLQSQITALCDAIQAVALAPITAGNYGNALTVASAAYAVADHETLLDSVPNRSTCVLLTAYANKVKPDWVASHQPDIVQESSVLTGAEANTAGFVARPEAMVLAYGYPAPPPASEVEEMAVPLPNGLTAKLTTWLALPGREYRASLDLIVGVAVGRSTALRILKSS